jgi:hypothetical protein
MSSLSIRLESQINPVADEVSALTAVVRPILEGILFSVKRDVIAQVGGYENCTLEMLSRIYRPGDGDCGLCFEYAVHDALNRAEESVHERVNDALSKYCKVPGSEAASVLFGLEKNGAIKVIDSAKARLTEESALLYGTRGRPARLRGYIDYLAAAFRRPTARPALPYSISGLWKADLFIGHTDTDKWVATTVKINPSQLTGAKGLRIGIVPSSQGKSDRIFKDDSKNLIVCPIPHDQAFMEIFYQGWGIVQQFIRADARVPKEVALPRPADRQVARYLADRRSFPARDVIEALQPLAQPELLDTSARSASTENQQPAEFVTGAVLAPVPKLVGK